MSMSINNTLIPQLNKVVEDEHLYEIMLSM